MKGNLSPNEYSQFQQTKGLNPYYTGGQMPSTAPGQPVLSPGEAAQVQDKIYGKGAPSDIRFPGSPTGETPGWRGAGMPISGNTGSGMKNEMLNGRGVGFPEYTPGAYSKAGLNSGELVNYAGNQLATFGGEKVGSTLANRSAGQLGGMVARELPAIGGGAALGTTTAGLIGSGLAGAAVGAGTYAAGDRLLPRAPEDGGYLHGVVNNLRDIGLAGAAGAAGGATQGAIVSAPIGGIGAYPGALTGAAAGLAGGIAGKIYGAGKDAYNYIKGGIDSRNAIADSNRTMAEHKAKMGSAPAAAPTPSMPAGLTVTPDAGIMNGIQTPKPTADSQITPLNGISNGMPVAPGVVNNPAPVGQPAPVAAPKPQGFQGPSEEEMAAFRKQTGTAFNPKSINDKLSLERMRNGEETFDTKQANAYRAAHKDYVPGSYSR